MQADGGKVPERNKPRSMGIVSHMGECLVSTQTHLHLPIKVKIMKKRAETRFWVYAGIITETKESQRLSTHCSPWPHFHPDPASSAFPEGLRTSCSITGTLRDRLLPFTEGPTLTTPQATQLSPQ